MYQIPVSSLFYVVTLIASELIFVYRLPRRTYFIPRLLAYLLAYPAACVGLGYFAVYIDGFIQYEIFRNLFQIGYFAVMFFLSVPLVMLCWRISLCDAIFFCIAGYSVEHIANVFVTVLMFIISGAGIEVPYPVRMFAINLAYKLMIIAGIFLLFVRPVLAKNRMLDSDKRVLIVSAINLIICMVLNIMKSYGMGAPVNSFTTSIICSVYALFGCTLCLWLQMGYFKENKLKEDNLALEQMLKMEARKNELSKSTVDMINIKCHDLKYQLGRLENSDSEDKKEIIKSLYDSFTIYDSLVKTGNEVFDLIIMNVYPTITGKSVSFTYIVDGDALCCMKPADISSLFGNLIDNAVEAVVAEDEDKRIISLNVRRERQMLVIHIHNYCSRPPEFDDGLPLTRKQNKQYHGFGVRSIRYLVERYGGEMRMSWANNVFSVDIMIPIPPK